MVDGLPSCEPGWGGGQSEVDTAGRVEVELVVVTVLCAELVVVGVELGGVEYWKIIRLNNFIFTIFSINVISSGKLID